MKRGRVGCAFVSSGFLAASVSRSFDRIIEWKMSEDAGNFRKIIRLRSNFLLPCFLSFVEFFSAFVYDDFGLGNFGEEFDKFGALFFGRHANERLRIVAVAVEALFGNRVKEGVEPIEIFVGERIVFVVVALGARER